MNDVKGVLLHLGYREIRPRGGSWGPTAERGGRYGTTGDTHILRRPEKPTCRLVDPADGATVATARRSCSISAPTS